MARWRCALCDAEHDELPMDIAYARPQQYFEIPEDEREHRVWFNEDTNADLCVIDGDVFLIRCYLPIPIEGGGEFGHGVWVLVNESAFRKYATFEDDGSGEPPFEGRLASEMPGYPGAFLLDAEIQLGDPSQRPSVRAKQIGHLLTHEQQEGVSMTRVHELVRAALPDMFE